jgi:hypothetical protein
MHETKILEPPKTWEVSIYKYITPKLHSIIQKCIENRIGANRKIE